MSYLRFLNLFVMRVLKFCTVLMIMFFDESSCKIVSTTPGSGGNHTNTTYNYAALESNTTDIPQSDIDDALMLDVGNYTTVKFEYFNDQNQEFNDSFDLKWNVEANRCADDYIRCLVNQDNPIPVCGYNRPKDVEEYAGYRTFDSYCDAYYDNCRRGYRYWRILDNGRCDFKYKDSRDRITETFRRLWNSKIDLKKYIES